MLQVNQYNVVLVCCSRQSHGSSLAGQYNLPLWRCGAVVLCWPQNIDNWSPAEHTHTHTHTGCECCCCCCCLSVSVCLCGSEAGIVSRVALPVPGPSVPVVTLHAALRPGSLLLLLLHWRLARLLLLQLTALHRVNSSKCCS